MPWPALQVVEECHKLGVLHGDLKPANFVLADRTRNPLFSNDINLLFGAPWLLAIDFGCSQYLTSQRFTKRTGTPGEGMGQTRVLWWTQEGRRQGVPSGAGTFDAFQHLCVGLFALGSISCQQHFGVSCSGCVMCLQLLGRWVALYVV